MDCKFVTIVRKLKSVYECVRVLENFGEFLRGEIKRDVSRFGEI